MTNRYIPIAFLTLTVAFPANMFAQSETDTPAQVESDASSQEEADADPGFLERQIQNALGGDGREVRISGLEGALSSEVKIGAIEVADADGTWLSIQDVTMNWRRLALLRGRVEIDSLTVGSIALPRAPIAAPQEAPSIEAEPEPPEPFSLPELPVSLQLGQLLISQLDLGAPLVGQDASMRIEGSAELAGGEGSANLQVERLDGPQGLIAFNAGFENETRRLFVNLDVEEEPGGLIAGLAKFPDSPSVDLAIAGDAPLSDFIANIQLATNSEERLAGIVEIGQTDGTNGPVVTNIRTDLGGDITPLFVPEYREFFGTDVGVVARIELNPEVGTSIEDLNLSSRALNLQGRVGLEPSGLPKLVDISGTLGTDDGNAVTLPIPGADTQVGNANLRMDYDASSGDAFTADITINQLSQGELSVEDTNIALDGNLRKSGEPLSVSEVVSNITARLAGLSVGDPDLDSALQPVEFNADLTYDAGPSTVAIRNLLLNSGDLKLEGIVDVGGVESGDIEISTDASLTTGDLARFAPVVGQPLDGSFDGQLQARFAALTGGFDVTLDGAGQDLAIGNPQVDPLLAGASVVALTASRSAQGIRLDRLEIETDEVTANGTGSLSSTTAALDLTAALREAGLLLPQLSGPLSLSAQADGVAPNYTIALNLDGEAITEPLGSPAALDSVIRYDSIAGILGFNDLNLTAGELHLSGEAEVDGLRNDSIDASANLELVTGDLARFAPLLAMPLAGSLDADLEGQFQSETGAFALTLDGQGNDIAIGNPKLDPLLAGETIIGVTANGETTEPKLQIERLDIHNPAMSLNGNGNLTLEAADLEIDAALTEINGLVPHLSGPITVQATAEGTAPLFTVALDAGGAAITDAIGSPVSLTADLDYQAEAGTLGIPSLDLSAGDLTLDGNADLTGLDDVLAAKGALNLQSGDLGKLAPLAGIPLGGTLNADIAGGYNTGTGDFDVAVKGEGQDVAIGSPQVDQLLDGITDIDIAAQSTDGTITIERLNVDNPDLTVDGGGTYAPEGGDLDLNARLEDLGLFVPQLRGPLTVAGSAQGSGSRWTVDLDTEGPSGLRALVAGIVSPTDLDLDIDAGLGNIGVFVQQIPGPATIKGKVSGNGTDYFVDVAATGPGGLTANAEGRAWGPAGTSDLAITGRVPLALANNFISPRSMTGTADIDLRLEGEPAVEALSGAITMAGGRFVDPTSRIVLEQMGLDLTFANAQANLDFDSRLSTGGRISVSGPVALTSPFDGNIEVLLRNLTLVDPQLYTVDAGGRITLTGPLAGGARIAGRIDIARAEIQIPNAVGGGGAVPSMQHVKEPRDSFRTRERAGLVEKDNDDGTTGAPVAYPLDILISAPARIFVRGRGLDTEFGGDLTITGDTQRPVPSGRFEVIRGRMNILSQVLIFQSAEISMGGDLVPDLYMVAVSQDADIDAQIIIEGPINDPELNFTSSPELPEDEVLSHLFFGRPLSQLSPLEVAQLLAAINTLTGGGGGVFEKVRQGVGVDQLNVGSDTDGNTEVTAGKYLSDDVYTDVTVNSEGTSRVRLNYEITPNLTATGGFDSEGDTRLGFSYERDY